MGKKIKLGLACIFVNLCFAMTPVAAEGNVSEAIKQAWDAAREQIIEVVNNVVFPICDMILVVFFFIKLGMSYFDYRKQGMFDWTGPAILFVCLCFTLTAPNYIWNII